MSPSVEIVRTLLPALHGVGWALVYSLVIGALLGGGLWILLAVMRRRAAWARYALCCGALVLLVGLPLRAGQAIDRAFGTHDALAERYAAELMREGRPDLGAPTGSLPGGWTSSQLTRAVESRHDADMKAVVDGRAALVVGNGLALLAGLWVLFAIGGLARLAKGWRAVNRLTTTGTAPASDRWTRTLARVQRRLHVGHPVRVLVSSCVDAPMLIGWWRPTILVPPGPHRRLTDAEVEAILAHEVAHVRRGDYAINLLQSFVEAVLFFHPVVWWLGMRIRDEREFCSDDLAQGTIDGSLCDYVRALVALESLRHRPVPQPALAAAGGSLLKRIRRLTELNRGAGAPRLEVDAVLVVVCLIGLWSPTVEVTRSAHWAAMTVMEHDLQLPRDFERIAGEVGIATERRWVRGGQP